MVNIGLQHVGGDDWIGGVYYLHNLVKALRLLPENEQPQLTVVLPSAGDERFYEDISGLARMLDLSAGAEVSTGAGRSVRQALARNERVGLGVRRVKRALGRDVNRALERRLRETGVSALFPCIRSMGAGFAVPWLAWAWDFQHKHLPEYFSTSQLRARYRAFADMATDARLIVTSSADALEDFDRFYPGVRNKLRVLRFHTVPDESWFSADVEAVRAKHDLPSKYLVLPNQFWAHKNHAVAFEAVRDLGESHPDVVLVCTGKTEDFRHPRHATELMEFVSANQLQERIRILGLLPRQEQIQVIRGAAAVVQPSLFEGWSTVVEDARVLGKPLFLSDIAVHREQDPPGAVYFDPASPSSLARAIAGRWEELRAGPDAAEEGRARADQHELVVAYARTFLGVIAELLCSEDNAGPAPHSRDSGSRTEAI